MTQHLGKQRNSNALRRNLFNAGIEAEDCKVFDLIAHGPIFAEVPNVGTREERMELHKPLRDIVAAMEKRLADDLREAGYNVLNVVHCKSHLMLFCGKMYVAPLLSISKDYKIEGRQ